MVLLSARSKCLLADHADGEGKGVGLQQERPKSTQFESSTLPPDTIEATRAECPDRLVERPEVALVRSKDAD